MPTAPKPSIAERRARVAALTRHRAADDPALTESRQQLRGEVTEAHVRKLVDAAPPLTDDQRRRLAAILQGDAG